MAWARTWPKVACDEFALEDMNELNSELNLRAGIANAAFVEGDGLRYAIRTMRLRVNAVLKTPAAPEGGFLNDSGYLYCPPAVASGDDSVNIFGELYGGGRLAWRNEDDGTEATGSSWWPPECSLEDSDPYIFHVNELYDVIDALEWNVLAPLTDLGNLFLLGQGYHLTTKQGALDDAWADLTGNTPTTTGTHYNQEEVQYTGDDAETPAYRVNIWHTQRFASLAIPATMTAARLYFCRLAYNRYLTGESTYSKIPAPQPNALVYVDNTTPVPLAAADWGFGALGLTVAIPDQNAPTYNGVWGGALTGLTADATNYFRFGLSCLTAPPQYVVDGGYWRPVAWAAMYASRAHTMFGQYVRLAVKRF